MPRSTTPRVAGTAVAGTDYISTDKHALHHPRRQHLQHLQHPQLSTIWPSSGSVTVNLSLSSAGSAILGSPSTATLTINYSSTDHWPTTNQTPTGAANGSNAEWQVGDNPLTIVTDPGDGNSYTPTTTPFVSPPLVYNSDSVDVRPVVVVNFASYASGPVPSQIEAKLTWNGVAGSWITYCHHRPLGRRRLPAGHPGSPPRSAAPGADAFTVNLDASFASWGDVVRTVTGYADVVVNSASAVGPGWALGGVDQLVSVSGGVLFVYGVGGSRFFASAGGGSFTSPPDDTGTLVQNGDGTYTYTDIHQTKTDFNSSGYMTRLVDANGIGPTYTYSASLLSTITGPDGGLVTLAYDGSNLLQSITAPGGRVTSISRSGSNLASVTLPDGEAATFSLRQQQPRHQRALGRHKHHVHVRFDDASTHGQQLGAGRDHEPERRRAGRPGDEPGHLIEPSGGGGDGRPRARHDLYARSRRAGHKAGCPRRRRYHLGARLRGAADGGDRPAEPDHFVRLRLGGGPDARDLPGRHGGHLRVQQHVPLRNGGHRPTSWQAQRVLLRFERQPGSPTDSLNRVTTYTYTAGGKQLQTVTDPLNHTTTYLYSATRQLTGMIDPLGDRTTYAYDSAGDLHGRNRPPGAGDHQPVRRHAAPDRANRSPRRPDDVCV